MGEAGRRCPCGSGRRPSDCCAPLISGARAAQTPLELMRSRYVAYRERNAAYLLRTWHPDTRPATLDFDPADGLRWTGLEILACSGAAEGEERGTVEFVARWRQGSDTGVLRERSRFVRTPDGGAWVYVDGDVSA